MRDRTRYALAAVAVLAELEPERGPGAALQQPPPAELAAARREVDWSWSFVLAAIDDGRRTRFHFRSRRRGG